MKFFILVFSTSLSFQSHAFNKNLVCSIVGNSQASTLKIEYTDNKPTKLYLKSPEEEKYRPLDLNVKVIFPKNTKGLESFSATPKAYGEIDWEHNQNCYVEVGTQWYFIFNHKDLVYDVQVAPFFATENERCRTPRHRPQPKRLHCFFKSK